MDKPKLQEIPLNKLTVNFKLNARESDDYDVDEMIGQIKAAGRIVDPLHVRKSDLAPYRGNRRTLAAQQIMADPNTSDELRANLQKLKCYVYDGLTPDEEIALIYDHSVKGLSRAEIVKAVWRLNKLMWSKTDICRQLYFLLAEYTGKKDKAAKAARLSGRERDAFLAKWLHGTLDQYLLAVYQMPEYIRDQFILQEKAVQGLLKDDQILEIKGRLNRKVVAILSGLQKADSEAGNWTDEGGPLFDAEIDRLKADKATVSKKVPTATELKKAANGYQDYGMRLALRYASGDVTDMDVAKHQLGQRDDEGYRRRKVVEEIAESLPDVKDETMAEILTAIVESDVEAVVECLGTITGTKMVPEESAEVETEVETEEAAV